MKQGSNTRGRPRGRVGGSSGKRTPNRNQTFDSNGPNVRLRGNAMQLVEKYTAMARDTSSQGDRVLSENYLQHADHYYRVYMALTGQTDVNRPGAPTPIRTGPSVYGGQPGSDDDGGDSDEDEADSSPDGGSLRAERPSRGNGRDRNRPMGSNGAGRPGDRGGDRAAERGAEAAAETADDGPAPEGDGPSAGETASAEAGTGGAVASEEAPPRRRAPRRTGRGASHAASQGEGEGEAGPAHDGGEAGGGDAAEAEGGSARPVRRTRRTSRRTGSASAPSAAPEESDNQNA